MKSTLILVPVLLGLASSSPRKLCGGGSGGSEEKGAKPTEPDRPVRPRPSGPIRALDAGEICVTSGKLERSVRRRMRVDGPKMRGVAPGSSGDVGELRFVYRGPTEKVAALASGQIRRQVGLKLRAADGCNLVYVMWRIEPKPGIEVQTKLNPGQRTHGECGTRGYRKPSPRRSAPVPALQPGSEHTLRAAITGQDVVVQVDGATVWEGDLGPEVLALQGPVGMRSDNVAVDVELLAEQAQQRSAQAAVPGRCASVSDGD